MKFVIILILLSSKLSAQEIPYPYRVVYNEYTNRYAVKCDTCNAITEYQDHVFKRKYSDSAMYLGFDLYAFDRYHFKEIIKYYDLVEINKNEWWERVPYIRLVPNPNSIKGDYRGGFRSEIKSFCTEDSARKFYWKWIYQMKEHEIWWQEYWEKENELLQKQRKKDSLETLKNIYR